MAMETQQASPMSKMDGTRLPSTPWPFWTSFIESVILFLPGFDIYNSNSPKIVFLRVFTNIIFQKRIWIDSYDE